MRSDPRSSHQGQAALDQLRLRAHGTALSQHPGTRVQSLSVPEELSTALSTLHTNFQPTHQFQNWVLPKNSLGSYV